MLRPPPSPTCAEERARRWIDVLHHQRHIHKRAAELLTQRQHLTSAALMAGDGAGSGEVDRIIEAAIVTPRGQTRQGGAVPSGCNSTATSRAAFSRNQSRGGVGATVRTSSPNNSHLPALPLDHGAAGRIGSVVIKEAGDEDIDHDTWLLSTGSSRIAPRPPPPQHPVPSLPGHRPVRVTATTLPQLNPEHFETPLHQVMGSGNTMMNGAQTARVGGIPYHVQQQQQQPPRTPQHPVHVAVMMSGDRLPSLPSSRASSRKTQRRPPSQSTKLPKLRWEYQHLSSFLRPKQK